ncbi:MAG: Ig-like domain-containing protein [Sulfurovum sp.]|nr:Ig-like domain-containing protein [Sulfurovum sp.]
MSILIIQRQVQGGDSTIIENPNRTATPTPTPTPIPTPEEGTSFDGIVSGTQGVTINPLLAGENLVSFTQPSHGTVTLDDRGTPNDTSDDVLIYVPIDGYVGEDSFSYTVTDSQGNVLTRNSTIIVAQMVASNGVTFEVLEEGEELLSFTQPSHGTVTLDDGDTEFDLTDDRLRYVPNRGYSGEDSFTYTIRDSAGEVVTKTKILIVEGTRSDSGDTLGQWSMLILMLLTGMIGLYYVRREEGL